MTKHTNESQEQAILRYLQAGQAITPIEALNRFGCFRLGARIHNLRKSGHDIQTRTLQHDEKRFASYQLKTTTT
jgi:hypothetical protein